VVNPISNDKMPAISQEKRQATRETGADHRPVDSDHPGQRAPVGSGDKVDISGAGRLFSETPPPAGRIQTQEQATSLAARIKEQFSSMGAQALQAHSGSEGQLLEGLLKGATA